MQNKNIFILTDKKIQHASNLPLIETTRIIDELDISSYEALIFTSKNGVKYLDSISSKWRIIPSYAISSQTAKAIEQKGGDVAFVGEKGHGDKFAQELIFLLKGKKTAFIGAKDVVSDLVSILQKNQITCKHIAVYETRCKEAQIPPNLPSDAIIIFSSPSTIECFFKNYRWEKTYKAVTIGNTTAKYLPQNIEYFIADETSLESCVQKALTL